MSKRSALPFPAELRAIEDDLPDPAQESRVGHAPDFEIGCVGEALDDFLAVDEQKVKPRPTYFLTR